MKLHNYQERIIDFCTNTKRSILSVGMGLGKTAATLHLIDRLKPSSCIIVAPKRVAEEVWKQEALKWDLREVHDKMVIVSGSKSKRLKALADDATPYKIISRDNLKDVEGWKCNLLILDELTSFKNQESKRSKAIHSIISERVVGLTGTFLANGAIDIFGQACAVGIYDCSKKSNFYAWRARYFRDKLAGAGLQFQNWVLNVPLEEVVEGIRANIFTLDSGDWLEIPEVEHFTHNIELSESEMKRYKDLEAFLHCDLDGEEVAFDPEQKFGKLQTLCNGFVYDENDEGLRVAKRGDTFTKIDAVIDLCEDYSEERERVLLFYAFKEEAVLIGEKLKERGLKFCSTSDKNFMRKWNNGEIDVLIAHPASAGHGLNLQAGGRVCIWSSLTYNFEYFAQANARLARQGQQRGVRIHYFLANKTVEGKKLEVLRNKTSDNQDFIDLTK